ncbi:MAG: DUF3604 domain-containing protein [Hyphomicrobiaceae bacterium]
MLFRFQLAWTWCLIVAAPAFVVAQDIQPAKDDLRSPPPNYSPFVERKLQNKNFAEGLYWGDTHLHSSYSTDAGMIGNRLPPEEAYRFARGEEVVSSTGQRLRIDRPLDFLVVADHAENLGLAPMISEANRDLLSTEFGRRFYDLVQAGKGYEAFQLWGIEGLSKNRDVIDSPKIVRTVWDRQIEMADRYNDPGRFTAFIGFEWTSINNQQKPSNLHRVVIFKEDGRKAGQVLPFSTFDSPDPEKLWDYMENYETRTGGSVLAIPHNGNLSNGLMFATTRLNGQPLDENYAKTRMRWEPLVEVTQIKGDGEAHPALSPDDEFADYGTWDKADIAGFQAKTKEMLPYEYGRSALQVGLQQEGKLGTNPFKFGMIGSTDAHTSVATTRDDNYWGKMASAEPSPDRWKHYVIRSLSGDDALSTFERETIASGLAGVWARTNTRAAIFDAMQAKEVFATTGTRIAVRLFGGWDYADTDIFRPDAISIGYSKGVPMGGDLPSPSTGADAPVFMVGALKDVWSANLDRIQIIKGWIDKSGSRRERIFDVALSEGRAIGTDGRSRESVENTVDEVNATYLNSVGAAELRAVWRDPDFDPTRPAFYYARVFEIPTPTWQAHDAKFFGVKMPDDVPLSHQERAYTSPIWYTPNSG